MEFTFAVTDELDEMESSRTFSKELLDDVVEQFTYFLRGVGYVFDDIQVVNYEESNTQIQNIFSEDFNVVSPSSEMPTEQQIQEVCDSFAGIKKKKK